MQDYQIAFLDLAIARGALLFGEFTLKSGRLSPYFFNSGRFDDGVGTGELGRYYAAAIKSSGIAFDMLYGPAYKGIPLVVATAVKLQEIYGINVPYAFNRKEAKDHGEGGNIVGRALSGRVLVVDDVISAGTSVRESVSIISAAGAELAGVAISLDRQERGLGTVSAVQEVEKNFGIRVVNIVGLKQLIAYLEQKPGMHAELERVRAYQRQYGTQTGI
ncbi:MAG: orotate phosphoribosyltransferase [Chromatiales bacterium]|jgi:orotate phosphoribosyltransferase|nr:orotate phosphoribosyltransferase [Chromatiales bacterium]